MLGLRQFIFCLITLLWVSSSFGKATILISGGGPAGLISALLIDELNMDLEVVVAEKRENPGRNNIIGLDSYAARLLSSLGFMPGFYKGPTNASSLDLIKEFDFADPPIKKGWVGFARLSRIEEFLRRKVQNTNIRFLPGTTLTTVVPKTGAKDLLEVGLSNGESLDVMHLLIAEGSKPSSLSSIEFLNEVTSIHDTKIVSPYQYVIIYFGHPNPNYPLAYFPATMNTDPKSTPIRILLDEANRKRSAYGFFPVLESFTDAEIEERIKEIFLNNPKYSSVVDTSSFIVDKRFNIHLFESVVTNPETYGVLSIIADARMSPSILTGRGLITAILDSVGFVKVLQAKLGGDPLAQQKLIQFIDMQEKLRKDLKVVTFQNIPHEMAAIPSIWPNKACESILIPSKK